MPEQNVEAIIETSTPQAQMGFEESPQIVDQPEDDTIAAMKDHP